MSKPISGDDGQAAARYAAWKKIYRIAATRFLQSRKVNSTFTGEDMRLYIERRIGSPPHHNSWGGMASSTFNGFKREGWRTTGKIERAGWAQMKEPQAKCRLTPLYRKTGSGVRELLHKLFD